MDTLGKTLDPAYVPLFKAMCSDRNSKVRISALRVLGEFKDVSLMPFFKERFQRDDSYAAQAEALRSIGKGGDMDQISFL